MSLSNSQKSRIKKILDESNANNYGDGGCGNFVFWIMSIPLWFFSSCERPSGISNTVFHIEVFIGIPAILLILIIIFYFMDRQDTVTALTVFPAIIAFIFSILNLFSELEWFHNIFPIFF